MQSDVAHIPIDVSAQNVVLPLDRNVAALSAQHMHENQLHTAKVLHGQSGFCKGHVMSTMSARLAVTQPQTYTNIHMVV